jgi:hypothetical protein
VRKKIALKKKFKIIEEGDKLREIDIQPPEIIKENNLDLCRLNKEKIHIDSVHHNNNQIIKSFYSKSLERILVLDSFKDSTYFYNKNC